MKKKKHIMRSSEKWIIALCVVVFIIMIGKGLLDGLITDFMNGLDVLAALAKHGAETSGAMVALVIGVGTFISSLMGKKKRG